MALMYPMWSILREGHIEHQNGSSYLQAGWLVVRVPEGTGNVSVHHRVQTGSGTHPASYSVGNRGYFSGGKAAGVVKLTTDVHLVSRSRMRGAILPLPQYAFMAWCSVEAQGTFILPYL
jgi:hypothetical protein